MKGNLKHAIELTFGHEGGLSLVRSDPGNWTGGKVGSGTLLGTKYGIAANTYPNLDIPNLTLDEAAAILDKGYWRKVWGDDLPAGVDFAMFDYAVNSGPAQAVKSVQRIVGTNRDGSMGPKTLAAINAMSPPVLIRQLCDERLAFMRGLKSWPTFAKGWSARVAKVKEVALDMTSIAPATVVAASMPVAVLDEAKAPAKPTETAVTATKQGKTQVGVIIAGAMVSVGTIVPTLTPYASTPWVGKVLPILAAVGAVGALIAGVVGLKIQSEHIAGGSPQ